MTRSMHTALADLGLKHKPIHHYGVKEAVFPFPMFPEVDPVLGPEMRSTGEVLGLADSFGMAFFKSQEGAKQYLPTEGTVLISVAKKDRSKVLQVAKKFNDMGFKIKATEGTHAYLAANGVESEPIRKMHEGRPNIVDGIKNKEIHLVVNTPIGRQGTHDDSYIRKEAIRCGVPYITTLTAALASADGIAARRQNQAGVKSLQSYHGSLAQT